MLLLKLFSSFLFDLAVWRRLQTTYWLQAKYRFGIFSCTKNTRLLSYCSIKCHQIKMINK